MTDISNNSLDQVIPQQQSMVNPLMTILYSDQFPDVFQNYSGESCKPLLDLLIDCPSNLINKKGPLGGYTALHWMSIKNECEHIDFLVTKCKAEIDCVANLGETPLLICIKNCNIYSTDLLINLGANLKVRDIYNRSILHWSAYSGKVLWFYYFQKHHQIANFNDNDQFLQTPLHIACASGCVEIANFLIETGDIDLFSQDINGNTVLHMAARAGMTRICWKISQKNRGECVRLASTPNKQQLRPYDLIRNEKSMKHRQIKEWLRMEALVNPMLANDSIESAETKKPNDLSLVDKAVITLKLSTNQQGFAEWFFRFISSFLVMSLPVLINFFVIPWRFSVLKGVLGYGSLIVVMWLFSRQKHRISHICGFENSYFIGFFQGCMVHNYFTYYYFIADSRNVINFGFLLSVVLTFCHFFAFYKLLKANPGIARENIRKADGTAYTIIDLLKSNNKPNCKTTKDSINWLTEPSPNRGLPFIQPYFCEHCMIIQATPTKHCKLCQSCCGKFDHHCLFINKCVGLKNHRMFIALVAFTLIAIVFYLVHLYAYLANFYVNLSVKSIPVKEQGSLLYYAIAEAQTVWLFTLFLVDIFGICMVSVLLYFQFKFLSLGYTQQFPHPVLFTAVNKKTSNLFRAIQHRLENLFIFFFESCDANEQLWYRQQSDYISITAAGKVIPLDNYPRDNDYTDDYTVGNFVPKP